MIYTFPSLSLAGSTHQFNLCAKKPEVERIRDKDMHLLVETELRRVELGVHGPRDSQSVGERKMTYHDDTAYFGRGVAQSLPNEEIGFDENRSSENIFAKPDEAEFGDIVELDFLHSALKKRKSSPTLSGT